MRMEMGHRLRNRLWTLLGPITFAYLMDDGVEYLAMYDADGKQLQKQPRKNGPIPAFTSQEEQLAHFALVPLNTPHEEMFTRLASVLGVEWSEEMDKQQRPGALPETVDEFVVHRITMRHEGSVHVCEAETGMWGSPQKDSEMLFMRAASELEALRYS
jgi:hypothetical protein